MDETKPTKLKMRIGAHEFEAEGPADVVKEQFEAFKELVQNLPAVVRESPVREAGTVPLAALVNPDYMRKLNLGMSREEMAATFTNPETAHGLADQIEQHKAKLAELGIGFQMAPSKEEKATAVDNSLPRIMRVEDRVVSLTVQVRGPEDAVLLLLYGQKILRDNDAVTGAEVMDGLEISGIKVLRADRILAKLSESGDAIAVGLGRAKRYRMTNTGMTKARTLAAELLNTVA